jgi:hypothetical protein
LTSWQLLLRFLLATAPSYLWTSHPRPTSRPPSIGDRRHFDGGTAVVGLLAGHKPRLARVITGRSQPRAHTEVHAFLAVARTTRRIYHHQRDSIEARLTMVFAALAVSRWIEATTGWAIKKLVREVRWRVLAREGDAGK